MKVYIDYKMSRLELQMRSPRIRNSKCSYPEQLRNSYELPPIAAHQNCHLSQWLPISSHSCTIFISAHTVSLRLMRALTQTPTAIRCYMLRLPQPLRLHRSLHCYSISCISAYMTIVQLISQLIQLFVSIRLTQLRTQTYALAYTQSRNSNSSSSTSPHILGLNAYIIRPFGHPS